LTTDAAAEARSSNKTLPLAVKDLNSAGESRLSIVTASDPQRKLKKLYKPAFVGKAPDPEDAGFALFHDKQGRDCR
jgi:hypothetical protein